MKVVELGQGHPLQTWLIDLLIGQSIQKKDSGVRAHSFRSLGVIFLKGRLVKLLKERSRTFILSLERESGMREKKIIGHRVRSREREKRTERTK